MVNVDIEKSLGTIVKYLLFVNSIYLFILIYFKIYGGFSLFVISLSFTIINISMLSLYKIFVKYEYMIAGLIGVNKIAKSVDKFAGRING